MTLFRRLLAANALAMLAALSGCQLPGLIASNLFPKERVKAQFHLPKDRTVLVLAEQPQVSLPVLQRSLMEQVNAGLTQHGLARRTVSFEEFMDLTQAARNTAQMSITGLGRRLGADLVIYVNIDTFTLKDSPSDSIWRGTLGARVKVVDVAKGHNIWPDSVGREVRVTQPPSENTSEAYGEVVTRRLATALAEKIVNLFRDHEVARERLPEGDIFAP